MNVDFTGTRFDGDGRRTLAPYEAFKVADTVPMPMRRGSARVIIEAFETSGCTVHSPRGSTVWVVVEWCRSKGIYYQVESSKHNGFYIKRLGQCCTPTKRWSRQ
jgi:hypothetical protein